jgi:ATP-dependent RNA/DNA helicase IGHMBP2
MDYFKDLLQLLKVERDEDLHAYKRLTESTSASERRSNGLCWFPIAIRNTEVGLGDYLSIEIERPSNQDISHQFRPGSSVAMFSNHNPNQDRVEGTIVFLKANVMKVSFQIDDLPDWSRGGKLGIDLLFDKNSYTEMEQALKRADAIVQSGAEAKGLLNILVGKDKPTFDNALATSNNALLNEQQQVAVNKIVAAQELAIVHGPPGTGKTTTLIHAIKALNDQDHKQILVVAPSNTAVDLLSQKLAQLGLDVVRIGNPARVSEKMLSLTLDHKVMAHPRFKDIKTLKKQASELKNMAHKYKRNFGKAEQEQRKALFNEAYRIMKDVDQTEKYIIDQVIKSAKVVAATLVGANHYSIRDLKFHTVVIDEAGQALEPACWIPVLRAKKLVFAGDHCQLPPTIKSNDAAKRGLNTTLFEKAVAAHPEAVVLLQEQYRMHKTIMGYSAKIFYGNHLFANNTVAERLLFAGDVPLEFIDTAGCGFNEKQEGTSISNPEEATFLLKYLTSYVEKINEIRDLPHFPSIGIISPYQEQIRTLKTLIDSAPILEAQKHHITINTIDSFQGQERDVIYISLTRSNAERVIGFLSDIRRMNVAMTRAKMKLVVIGDSATLSRLAFYADFISYADEMQGYHSAWEYLAD